MSHGLDPSSPIQSQPRRQENTYIQEESHKKELVARPGLQCLDDVDEVVFKRNVFYTRSGVALFGLYMGYLQSGPDLCFRDPYMKDLAALYLLFNGDGGKGGTYLRAVTPPDNTIGYVNITYSEKMMNVSILMANNDLVFTSSLPKASSMPKAIDIFSVNQPHVVAEIKLKEQTSQVVFQFLADMNGTLKMLVLASFLYMNFKVQIVNQAILQHEGVRKIFSETCDVNLENADNSPADNVYIDTKRQIGADYREKKRHYDVFPVLHISHKPEDNCTDDDDCCDSSCDGICCCCCCCCEGDGDDCGDCDCDDICCGDLF